MNQTNLSQPSPGLSQTAARQYARANPSSLPAGMATSSSQTPAPPPVQLSTQLLSQTEELRQAIAIYNGSKVAKNLHKFDLSHDYTWEEVLEAGNKAQDEYEAATKKLSFHGVTRKALHGVGIAAPAINPWLNLLPSGDYSSIVCGALKVLFGGVVAIKKTTERALDVLHEIPHAVEKASQLRMVYNDDIDLQDKSTALYVAILHAVCAVIYWLTPEKHIRSRLWAFLKGPEAEQGIDVAMNEVQDKNRRLLEYVDVLGAADTHETRKAADRIESKTQQTFINTNVIAGQVKNINQAALAVGGQLTTIGTQVEDIHGAGARVEDNVEALRSDVQEQQQLTKKLVLATDSIMNILADQFMQSQWMPRMVIQNQNFIALPSSNAINPQSHFVQLVSLQELQQILNVDPQTWIDEINTVNAEAQRIDPHSQGHIMQLLQSPGFQNFMHEDRTQFLAVEGNSMLYATRRITPVSILDALLIQSLRSQTPAYTIQFFCGLHMQTDDPLHGMQGLLRSLVAQLLVRFPFDTRAIDSPQLQMYLQQHDLGALWDILFKCLLQVPPGSVIFCIIDGVSLFEADHLEPSKLQWTINQFYNLIWAQNLNMVFKMLITCSGTSRFAMNQLPETNRLRLPASSIANPTTMNSRLIANRIAR